MNTIEIIPISQDCYHELAGMVGELLNEIMDALNEQVFNFDLKATEIRAKHLIEKKKYWVFLAKEKNSGSLIGFVSLYESYALYSEGAYGTIPELYIRPQWRSNNIGKLLLNKAMAFAQEKQWKRLEVTTPPLPAFEKTLSFYKMNGFVISGGRKLKIDIK